MLEFRALGPLEVDRDGVPLSVGGTKQRTLLAALLAARGQAVSTDSLIDTLWGEDPPPTALKTVQKYASRLRKQIGDTLVTTSSGYAIEIDPRQSDISQFEQYLAGGKETERRESLTRALELWRGKPLQDLADDVSWQPVITQLEEQRLQAHEELIDLELAAGADSELIPQIEALVADHPGRERFTAQLMVALYRANRQSEALKAYTRLRTHLGTELGIEPSEELQNLEEKILLQDSSLRPELQAGSRTNLVAPLSTFVGRQAEMAETARLLSRSQLVTLHGPAGSGKTRLAVEFGLSVLDKYEDGVWCADMAPVRSPDQIFDAIAEPLGLGSIGEQAIETVLLDHLEDRQPLLVIDNCEHLAADIAARLELLLGHAPRLTVIATSRERLGIAGELLFEVPPLAYPQPGDDITGQFDALELFEDRASSSNPSLELSDHRDVAAEIVRRLDGIPLALELAAARAANVSLHDMRDLLDNRFALLTAPRRDHLGRHQTLHAAVGWSYDLLTEDERVLFRRLSVFRGGFDIESATEVCGFDPITNDQVLPLLNQLADRSLVRVDPRAGSHTRFTLLETMREYGQALLDKTEATAVRDAHARFFCAFAERTGARMRGEDHRNAISALARDSDNIRKALRWASTTDAATTVRLAVAMSPYWDNVGPRAEGHEWLQRAIDLSPGLEPELRVRALLEATEMFASENSSRPRGFAEQALALAREAGDELNAAKAQRALCWAIGLGEDPERAIPYGLEALATFRRLGETWEEALCLERLGQIAYNDPEWSIDQLQAALDLYRGLGDPTREALTLSKLADRLAQAAGDVEKATAYAREAIAIADQIGDSNEAAHARLEYGKVLRRAGEAERATEMLALAHQQLSRSGDNRCSLRALTALGLSQVSAGHIAEARDTLHQSLENGREIKEATVTRVALAGLARAEDDPGRAATIYGFVNKMSEESGVPVSEASQRRRSKELDDIRALLGETEFRAAWDKGTAMTLDEIVQFANRQLTKS